MYQADVIVECPHCRAVPNVDQLNERMAAGAGVLGCGNCGKVESLRNWVRVTGAVRPA